MEQQPNNPTIERKKQGDAESTVTPDPKSLSGDDVKRGTREDHETHQALRKQQALNKHSDEATLEPKGAVVKTESLDSLQAVSYQFSPSISAQSEGSVVAPSFQNSQINAVNININQGVVNQDASSQPKTVRINDCQQKLKDTLKRKFSYLPKEMATEKKRTLLRNVFTAPRIIKGGSGDVNKEHEVRKSETEPRTIVTEEESICCSQLFIPPWGQDFHIRTVITRGIAGIGKTVSTYEVTLDWAERENTNLDFVFPVPFKDLNLMKEKTISLVDLLTTLFPELKGSEIFTLGEHKMLFIFDGLEESKLSLTFDESEIVSDVMQPTKVNVLVVNIIRGRLLPSALVWITSRPEASDQIPHDHIDLVIEVQGFNNSQKDEYFRKKIVQPGVADKAITQMKSCRTLHIMCHIPFFCWMLASDLEKKLANTDGKASPKSLTLTPMFIQYLILYMQNMRRKFPGTASAAESVRAEIISLGRLAFEKLDEDSSIFEESDLSQNRIKVAEPSMLSGIYTQIFSEELTLFQENTFSFVHLSVQEFFAALYVYLTFNDDKDNLLIKQSFGAGSEDLSELNLFKAAVEKALQSENGHFDIFLRFLLGLSLESNQKPLKHLICNKTNKTTRAEIIEHIKEKIRASPSPDSCLNLFHCLRELDDHSLEEGGGD